VIGNIASLGRWEWFKLRKRWMLWILLVFAILFGQLAVWGGFFSYQNLQRTGGELTVPATLLPTKLTSDSLRSFLTDYQVAYVLLDLRDHDRRDYRDDLEGLAPAGVTVTTVGASFRIYDTRPLWRH